MARMDPIHARTRVDWIRIFTGIQFQFRKRQGSSISNEEIHSSEPSSNRMTKIKEAGEFHRPLWHVIRTKLIPPTPVPRLPAQLTAVPGWQAWQNQHHSAWHG